MTAQDIQFGIEIETTMPAGSVAAGGYHCGVQVAWLPTGWKGERDGSIQCSHGRIACEYVSPILCGNAGIRQVVEVVEAIRSRGGQVNASCGFHVHVSFPNDAAKIARLVNVVANFERAIFAATGTKQRERGHYCRGIQQHGDATRATSNARVQRYHILNLTNVSRGHVEFRAFSGTLNIIKIVAYIRLCVALVEKALLTKRACKFIAKPTVETSPVHRGGEGATALARLILTLGWTRGRSKYIFGDLTADNAPTTDAIKKELMRLAHKYDGERA